MYTYQIGEDLDAYLRFRAVKEGVEYDLSPEFFANALEEGVSAFFGVIVSGNGQLLDDEQHPDLFKEWSMSLAIPLEDRAYLREHVQIWNVKTDRSRWVKRKTLHKWALSGKAEQYMAVDINFNTGEKSLICPRCATGIEHEHSLH
jgi:hypothetical protein